MNMKINLEMKYNRLIEIFRELSCVPRNSKHEEKIGEYILNRAKELGLEARMDDMFNVVVKKPGIQGRKKLMFQAHTDMVCVKKEDIEHNFETDPIEIIEENGVMYANGTTLGGDDGIGCAFLLLLMEDNEFELPDTTFVFTTQEEIGMYGAKALDYSDIEADYLINLDGEEENTAIVGCAGGVSMHYTKSCETQEEIKDYLYSLEISGLFGGHSGVDIDKDRINSNYLAALMLNEIEGVKISSFVGGTKDNAIPSNTKVLFTCPLKDYEVEEKIADFTDTLIVSEDDSNLEITVEYKEDGAPSTLSEDDTKDFLRLMLELKQSVIAMSRDKEGLVETSGNIGIVKIEDGKVYVCESLRSSIDAKKDEIKEENNSLANELGYEIEEEGAYPGWKYNPNSTIEKAYKEAYEKTHEGASPIICAIHAGVECGMIYENMPNLDMISLGPDVVDVHTVNEKLYLESCKKMLNTLIEMIEIL